MIWRCGLFIVLALAAANCELAKYISIRHNVAVSEAMSPTIEPGDHFGSVGIRSDEVDPIQRFDIVVFRPPKMERFPTDEATRFVFRVIGLPGENIELRSGKVYINGVELDESGFSKRLSYEKFAPSVVPEGEYFLMGDNRSDSMDSRQFGTIKRDAIDGKVQNIIRKADYENGKRW